MSVKNRINDELAWLRVTYVLVVAADFSLIAWLAQHATYPATPLFWVVLLATFALHYSLFWIAGAALRDLAKTTCSTVLYTSIVDGC